MTFEGEDEEDLRQDDEEELQDEVDDNELKGEDENEVEVEDGDQEEVRVQQEVSSGRAGRRTPLSRRRPVAGLPGSPGVPPCLPARPG
eukprot:12972197-Heterocapsa_arctica.AAC.1